MDLHHFQQLQPACTFHSRTVTTADRGGLQMHLIEAFPTAAGDPISLPLIVLLHGFPELAYSWRKVVTPLATARGGYHVIAPDTRGYGRTLLPGNDKQIQYDDPIAPFHPLNVAEDVRSLVKALGHGSVALLVGHDFGSIIAGYCVTAFPELFRSVVFMSAPCTGVEQPPHPSPDAGADAKTILLPTLAQAVATALTTLSPPRKHYTSYFCTRDANADLLGNGQEDDIYRFLGGYYHMKSGAWEGNTTHPLPSASSASPTIMSIVRDLATLPEYYVMPAHENMRQLVERQVGLHPQCTWPADESGAGRVYAAEFSRTGFQGGLNYYRALLSPPPAERVEELIALSGRHVRIPAAFVAGARDWGVYQTPGSLEKMKRHWGMQNEDIVLIEGAGHWVQQEAADSVVGALLQFLDKVPGDSA